jgi:hypothetical protein
MLRPKPEVVLFGDDQGSSRICAELNVQHHPELERTEFGHPSVSDLLRSAQVTARADVVCYVNCDIVLMSDFMDAVQSVLSWRGIRPFLAIGTRWNVWMNDPIDFSTDWERQLRRAIEEDARPGTPGTLDYFVFSRGLYKTIPSFGVGQPYWDNWMVYAAWRTGARVLDLTPVTKAVHQRHDYGRTNQAHSTVYQGYTGPAAERYRALAGVGGDFGLREANHVVTTRGVEPAWRARGSWTRFLQRFRRRTILLQAAHPVLQRPICAGRSIYVKLRRSKAPMAWASHSSRTRM